MLMITVRPLRWFVAAAMLLALGLSMANEGMIQRHTEPTVLGTIIAGCGAVLMLRIALFVYRAIFGKNQ